MEEPMRSSFSGRNISLNDIIPFQPVPSDEVEEEISPLEYARINGLSRNYLGYSSGLMELDRLRASISEGVIESDHLLQFDFGPELRIDERLSVSKEAAILIASAAKAEPYDDVMDLNSLVAGERLSRKMKIELPLFKSDNETDCRTFARRDTFEIKIQDVRFPLELVNEENNEGLTFPARLWDLSSKTFEDLKREKLSVSKEIVVYLLGIMEASWSKEDNQVLWDSLKTYKKNTALEPVTPPLSPRLSPYRPFEPSPSHPAFQIPILSDPFSPTKQELAKIEKKIFEQDVPTPLRNGTFVNHLENASDVCLRGEYVKLGDIYSPLVPIDDMQSPSSIEPQRLKRENLKVEEILTPEGPEISLPKSVRFSDVVEEMELDLDIKIPIYSPGFESRFFEEAFGPALETATRQSEQERLLDADTTARVSVPIMDFSKRDPPWKIFEQISDSITKIELQKSIIRDVLGTDHRKWTGVKKAGDKLKWNPFPHNLGKLALEEDFRPDDSTWSVFIPDIEGKDVLDSTSVVWKPDGLRILKGEEEEDDIEFGQFQKDPLQDLGSLVKKRKMMLEESGQWRGEMMSERAIPDAIAQAKLALNPTETTSAKDTIQLDGSNSNFGILGSGAFSAINSLDSYLELRGAKKPKLIESTFFRETVAPQSEPQAGPNPINSPRLELPFRESPLPKPASLPSPQIDTSFRASNIIVSSTLLKHRTLVKWLEKQLPDLILVERDFSAHNSMMWMPGSVTRSPITSPLASEADLIICPSTGIIITTLQKIKQKPLPGQKAKAAIRERLEQVALRYEKLVVFVSEDRSDETSSGLDETACLAYAEFTAFALGLDTSISVQFVGGGEETLSKWLVSAIAQHRMPGTLELLLEETHWEIFLRRAGMNAFAAQAIIAEVKSPEGVDLYSLNKKGIYGLSAFVEMGREERLRRFSAICGQRIMERVSAVLDEVWTIS